MRVFASGGLRAAAMRLTVAGAAPAADLPDAVRKLGGSSDEAAAAVMAQNGYVRRIAKASWGRKLTYWWSDKARQCVQLTSLAGGGS